MRGRPQRRRRTRDGGAAPFRPGDGVAASPFSRGAPAPPSAPRDAALATAPPTGPVGREGRPFEATERRHRARAPGAASPRPGGGGAASPLSHGAPATAPPPERSPQQRRRVPDPGDAWGGPPRVRNGSVAPELPGRPLHVRAAAGRRRHCHAARWHRPPHPAMLPCQRGRAPGPWDKRGGPPWRWNDAVVRSLRATSSCPGGVGAASRSDRGVPATPTAP